MRKLFLLITLTLLAPATADSEKTEYYLGVSGELEKHTPPPGGFAKALQELPQKITREINGITFDSDYDNGSLESVAAAPGTDVYNCEIYTEHGELGPRDYWFRFRMTGVAGRTVTLNIEHSQSPRPAISLDGGDTWRRLSASEAPTGQIIVSFGDEENEAELAFFEPSGYAETHQEVRALADASPFASVETIGTSHMGREMLMVTVTDPRFPDDQKHRVWMHSRAHAGEVTSTHSMLGFLEKVTADSELGERLRQNCIFNIVPLENVDGVWAGHTRWDMQGKDPERDWCAPSIPAVLNIKNQVDPFMAGDNPIEVALNMHSTKGSWTDTFFFKHVSPSVSRDFETIQQNYIDAFDNASELFANLSAQTSQLSDCLFIESYFWNNWGEDVMAMTHEGHYRRRHTDNGWITGDDYREIGGDMAEALVEYFDLPGKQDLPPLDSWFLY